MFFVEKIISLVAPHTCVQCGKEGNLLCYWCLPDVLSPLPSRCYRCHALTSDCATCAKCRKQSSLKNVWIVSSYEGGIKTLIAKLKFERAASAAVLLADSIDEHMPVIDDDVVVCHVPTATSRRRQRGYDQSELIARHFSKKRRLGHCSLLARTGQSRQVGSSKEMRAKQMEGAYRVIQPKLVKGASILLIDDLTTTGSTLESAARTLKAAGAKNVFAATVAQKL